MSRDLKSFINSHFPIEVRDSERFQRIPLKPKLDGKTHLFYACVDTHSGGVYIDCRRRKIFAKMVISLPIRVMQVALKTLWHISILGPLLTNVYSESESKLSLRQRMIESCKDIIRTPSYGTALIAIQILAIVTAVVHPNSLYTTRALTGKLERKMLRLKSINENSPWLLTDCFAPFKIISSNLSVGVQKANLTKWAEKNIVFRQTNSHPFNDCGRKRSRSEVYISAAYRGETF